MTRRKLSRVAIGIILAFVFGSVAQSCNSSKKCGCGADINGVYKHKKFRSRY